MAGNAEDSTDSRWLRVEQLVADALALPPAGRPAMLARECRDDADLRREVESLLAHADQTAGFLSPDARAIDGGEPVAVDPWLARRVGGFELRALLGAGGMGRVYEAWQDPPGRAAAVKVVSPLSSAEELRRFEFEAAILARLRHPNIAHLYASGLVDDPFGAGIRLPYFAMELVPGARSITGYANDEALDLAQRIELFLPVCEAVHHAHQRGVLHRDLKPSNLLVDADGRPRVIDFGIARSEDREQELTRQYTRTGEVLGTLHYMSPQQCSAAKGEVDARSDVYSLGLVLYELVTGARAHDLTDTTLYEALRVIREQPPKRPSLLAPWCRGDLETIILKSLEKQPDDRYASVSELVADLRRYLASEPIAARPPGMWHRLRLFARRNPLAAAAVAIAVLALLGGTIAATTFAVREGRAANEARRQARIASAINEFLNQDLLGAVDPWSGADAELRVRDVLDRAAERITGRFAAEPLVEAGVRESVGRGYLSIARPADAAPQLERAVAILGAEYGLADPHTVAARIALARALVAAGDRDDADTALVGILRDATEEVGRARALAARGELRRRTGRRDEALTDFESARAILRAALGDDDLEVLMLGSSVAVALREVGRLADSESLQREMLDQSRRLFGDQHPRTLASLANLALVVQDQGRLEEAGQMLTEVVRVDERVLGPDHESTLLARRNLAIVLQNLRQLEAAEQEIRLAVEGFRSRFGADHDRTISAEMVLATVLLAQRDAERAEPILRSVVERANAQLGPGHPVTGEATLHLTRLLSQRGARDDAIELLRGVVGDGPATDATEVDLALGNQLGSLLVASGAFDEAEPLLARVAGLMRARFGTHIGTAMTIVTYGRCLRGLGRVEEAREALLEARGMLVSIVGEDHARTRMVDEQLATLAGAEGR